MVLQSLLSRYVFRNVVICYTMSRSFAFIIKIKLGKAVGLHISIYPGFSSFV